MSSKKVVPISVVTKKRKNSTPSFSKKRPSSSHKKKKTGKKRRNMPSWLIKLVAVLLVLLFSASFYYFFIRPYAYRWKQCPGDREYGVCMPMGYEIHGIDISHYQGTIDWKKLSEHQTNDYPIHFVFIKATEGGNLSDDKFLKNFEAARQFGFIRGAYHFFNPETPADRQADFFIKSVTLCPGDLPPVLDVEKIGKRKKEELVRGVKTWLDRVEAHYGVKPILYTSYKFKTKYLNDSLFNDYPYWIAHYYVDSVQYTGKWHFWQHTDVGNLQGITENVDLNIFNGSLNELSELTIQQK